MALINLKTSLKSLKYQGDTVGGGNSNQPYIRTPIPESWMQIGNTGGPDTLIRGGSLILEKSRQDTSRIAKFLTDGNNVAGLGFIPKLAFLSKQNVKTQVDNTLLNQGDPGYGRLLQQTATVALGEHLPLFRSQNYLDFFKPGGISYRNTANRLVYLTLNKINPDAGKSAFVGGKPYSEIPVGDPILLAKNQGYTLGGSTQLYSYQGGPQGDNTTLQLSNPTQRVNTQVSRFNIQTDYTYLKSNNSTGIVNVLRNYEVSSSVSYPITSMLNKKVSNDPKVGTPPWLYSAAQISSSVAFQNNVIVDPRDFRSKVADPKFGSVTGSYERPWIFGRPGMRSEEKNYYNPNSERGTNAYKSNPGTDLVNFKYIYSDKDLKDGNPDPVYDFVDFHIAVYPNARITEYHRMTHLHFTAFLNGINDNFNAEWEAYRVMGRGENFYSYQGFTREFSFNFDVHAQSKPELLRQKYKLDYLSSLIYPDYSAAGFMQGNFVELTIGDWLYQVPGIIQGFTYSIPDESPWQIQDKDPAVARRAHDWNSIPNSYQDESVLPHLIKVQGFKFIPLQKFTPKRWSRDDLWRQQLDPVVVTKENADRVGVDAPVQQNQANSENSKQAAANWINTQPYLLKDNFNF